MLASIEGKNGENIMIRDIDNEQEAVYLEVGKFKGWVRVHYDVMEDGTYNQSVKDIDLPYIVVDKNVYSVSEFKIWDKD